MKRERKFCSEAGKARIFLLLIMALVALSVYLIYERPELVDKFLPGLSVMPKPAPLTMPEPTAPATPITTPEATSEPTPMPEAAPVATPVAVTTSLSESQLDFAKIAATPALWPKQVALLQETSFPLIYNGKVVGHAPAPVGTLLQVVQVLPDLTKPQVAVLFQNNRQIVSASSIDLIPRATALKKAALAKPL
jgi:hypothetical protein